MRAAWLALLIGAGALWAGPARGEDAEQLARDVKSQEEALERLRDQTASVLDELAAAEDDAHALEDSAEKAEASARESAQRLAAAQREEAAARQSLEELISELGPRLKARYQMTRQKQANLLLSARSLRELLFRKRALDALLEQDLRLLKRARQALGRLQARRASIEKLRREQTLQLQIAQTQRDRANARKAELLKLHQSLMGEQALRQKTLEELYKAQEKLNRFVAGLQKGAGLGLGRRRGKLLFPTRGLIEVGFGRVLNPKFNTVTFQKGIDIRAPHGAEVSAVAPGKVVHAGPFRGYGNLVIVDHGEGYHSLYAHLAHVARAVGEPVGEGDAVGKVGDTGSLKGSYLYFEIREAGKAVDPARWLGPPPKD